MYLAIRLCWPSIVEQNPKLHANQSEAAVTVLALPADFDGWDWQITLVHEHSNSAKSPNIN